MFLSRSLTLLILLACSFCPFNFNIFYFAFGLFWLQYRVFISSFWCDFQERNIDIHHQYAYWDNQFWTINFVIHNMYTDFYGPRAKMVRHKFFSLSLTLFSFALPSFILRDRFLASLSHFIPLLHGVFANHFENCAYAYDMFCICYCYRAYYTRKKWHLLINSNVLEWYAKLMSIN